MTIWTIPWTGSVLAADTDMDLWELLPADDLPILIRGIMLGQTSEIQDAEEFGLEVTVKRLLATVTGGSGGASGAPESVAKGNQTPGFSSEVQNDTVATSSGTTEILDEIGWINRQSPLPLWYPDRDFCPRAQQGEALVVRLETTVPATLTFVGNIWVEEL